MSYDNTINQELVPISQYIRTMVKRYLDNFETKDSKHIINLYKLVLNEVEKPLLEMVLEYTNSNQSQAAKLLGISRNTLRKLIKSYSI